MDDPLVVGDSLADRTHLRRKLEHLRLRVGRDDRGDAAVECVGERGQVTGAPRELHRLAAQLVATPARRVVAQRAREPGEEPHAKLVVVVRERREPRLQQWNELLVSPGSRPDDPSAVACSRAGELPRQAEALGDLRRCKERALRCRPVAGTRECIPDREQQLDPCALIAHVGEVERVERQVVQPGRLLVREQRECPLAGLPRIVDGLVELARGHGVVGELGEVRPGRVAVQTLQRLHGQPVQPDAPGRRQAFVERVADQDMREPQTPRRPGDVAHEPRSHRLVERLEQRVISGAAHRREHAAREFATEDGCELEHAVALGREVRQAPGDHVPDALRDRDLALESLDGDQPHRLGDEERVSVGLFVQRGDQLGRAEAGRGELDVFGHRALAPPGERQATRDGLTRELCQGLLQRCAWERVDVPQRAEHEQSAVAELTGDELKEEQRRRVGGMEVVEGEEKRA